MRKAIFIFSCLFLFSSCYKDNEEALYGDANCQPQDVSFSGQILPIISNSCAIVGCHVQGGLGNGLFENYAQLKTKVDNGSLLERVVVEQDMPPNGVLPSCQIQTIQQWILEGAPNN